MKLTEREIELCVQAIAFGTFGPMNVQHSIPMLANRLSFEIDENAMAKISEAFSESLRPRPRPINHDS